LFFFESINEIKSHFEKEEVPIDEKLILSLHVTFSDTKKLIFFNFQSVVRNLKKKKKIKLGCHVFFKIVLIEKRYSKGHAEDDLEGMVRNDLSESFTKLKNSNGFVDYMMVTFFCTSVY
jgi:hypothetical protein